MINERRQRAYYVIADFISTNLALLIYNCIRYYFVGLKGITSFKTLGAFLSSGTLILEQILFPLLMIGVYAISGYYNSVFVKSRLQELLSTASTALIGTIIMFLIVLTNDMEGSRIIFFESIIPLWLILTIVVYIPRLIITGISSHKIERGIWGFNTLIVGTSASAANLVKRLQSTRNKMGIRIVGYVSTDSDSNDSMPADLPVFDMENIAEVCKENGIKKIIVVPHKHGMRATNEVINRLFPLDLPILISPDLYHLITSRPRVMNVASEPLVDVTHCSMSATTANMKRLGDIVFSTLALILISPVIAVMAVLIKKDSPGPVFYKQQRLGRHKKPFNIYKLRSMTVDAEANGPSLSTPDDPRITPLGRFMRKYRLDELPQFWNVLKGDMSIVGPRPEREYYVSRILERAPHYTLVHQVRPGVTSWGMVKYGYAMNIDEMLQRLPYDLLYVENVSFVIDLKIIIYTIRTVLTGRGI